MLINVNLFSIKEGWRRENNQTPEHKTINREKLSKRLRHTRLLCLIQ